MLHSGVLHRNIDARLMTANPGTDPLRNLLHIADQLFRSITLQLMDNVGVVGFPCLFQDGLEDFTLDVVSQFLASITSALETQERIQEDKQR